MKVKVGRFPLPRCGFGVPSLHTPEQVMACGEPAVAKWIWDDGVLYVCAEHNEIIEESEASGDEPTL